MSVRLRKDGTIICGAKSKPQPGDVYIDDQLHYDLAVKAKILIPTREEKENGLWYIKYSHRKVKKRYRRFMKRLLLLKQENKCGICGLLIDNEKECNFDHIQPDSKGGCHTIDNLQITHVKCNTKKGNHPPLQAISQLYDQPNH